MASETKNLDILLPAELRQRTLDCCFEEQVRMEAPPKVEPPAISEHPAKAERIISILVLTLLLCGCESDTYIPLGTAFVRPATWSSLRDWQRVEAPAAIVEHARTQLDDGFWTWKVAKDENFGKYSPADRDFTVVSFTDRRGKEYNCSVIDGRWTWLGGSEGLDTISKLYQNQLKNLVSGKKSKDVIKFCGDLALLRAGSYREALSTKFRTRADIDDWRNGTHKKSTDLFDYCKDPVISKGLPFYTIRFYVISGGGSIERWTLRTKKRDGFVEMLSVEMREVEKWGTFTCPLCGGNGTS